MEGAEGWLRPAQSSITELCIRSAKLSWNKPSWKNTSLGQEDSLFQPLNLTFKVKNISKVLMPTLTHVPTGIGHTGKFNSRILLQNSMRIYVVILPCCIEIKFQLLLSLEILWIDFFKYPSENMRWRQSRKRKSVRFQMHF